jgi:hypothetical protein
METATSNVPTGPLQGHSWFIEPITHKLVADGPRRCLKVRTGFLWLFFMFFLSIGCFTLLDLLLVYNPWLSLGLAPVAALGLTVLILRSYRSRFWEVTIDTARGVAELRRGRITEVVPIASIVGFQIYKCIDRKASGFIRYHNIFHQLILVYERAGEIHRRLITSSGKGEIVELMDRLRKDVKLDVTEYAA